MKNIFSSILILCFALHLSAQDKLELLKKNTWPVSSINLQDTADDDLQKLADAIGDSRIVMLGGMENNDGETIRAKARIVRFLHQRMGFSVLAMPSDFYGTNMLWDTRCHGDSALMAVPESIKSTLEFYSLKQYISEHSQVGQQLEISGYDIESSYHPGLVRFTDEVKTLFKDLGYNPNDAAYLHYINTLLRANDPQEAKQMEDTTFGYLKYFTKTIIDDINKKPQADHLGFWAQSLRNYLGNAYMNWQYRADQGKPNTTIRDRQMAANLLWITDQKYASRKIIVWADNKSISRNNETIEILVNKTVRKPQPVTVASELTRYYGGDVFTIGFTSLEGKVLTKNSSSELLDINETGRNDWFTTNLGYAGFTYAFSDFRTIGAYDEIDANFIMRAWTYEEEMKGDWFRVFDGMFYLKTNRSATPTSGVALK
jgi:erythromycin esterase